MTRDDLARLALHPNVSAFLAAIRLGEGTQGPDGYRTMFTGKLFDDFSRHPNVVNEATVKGRTLRSTAAGAYQFLARTWDELVAKWGFPDFTPASQDAAAVALLVRRKALDFVLKGRIKQAVDRCAREWASLPGSPYGQPVVTLNDFLAEYMKHGGTFAPVEEAAPAAVEPVVVVPAPPPVVALPEPEPPAVPRRYEAPRNVEDYGAPEVDPTPAPTPAPAVPPPPRYEPPPAVEADYGAPIMPVLPIVAALMPDLVRVVPSLIRIFGSEGRVTERNAQAAEQVGQILVQATEAVNVQEAAERVIADPDTARAVEDTVRARWFDLVDAGAGVERAREANQKAATSETPFWRAPAIWVTAMLLPLVYMVTYAVLFDREGVFSDDLRTVVVSAIMLTLVGAIIAYWYGTTHGSAKKTDILANERAPLTQARPPS